MLWCRYSVCHSSCMALSTPMRKFQEYVNHALVDMQYESEKAETRREIKPNSALNNQMGTIVIVFAIRSLWKDIYVCKPRVHPFDK